MEQLTSPIERCSVRIRALTLVSNTIRSATSLSIRNGAFRHAFPWQLEGQQITAPVAGATSVPERGCMSAPLCSEEASDPRVR
jgi:hypothetical protein